MSLVTSNTNLKSLKYGNDRPNGGSSNQPYIKSKIPNGRSLESSINTPDVITRGGLLAPIRAAEDVVRLTKMFTDFKSPSGLLYILKENILSRASPKTEASFGIGYGMGLVNAGIYTPISTLLQSAGNIAGLHVNHLGIDPLSPKSGELLGPNFPSMGLNNYEDVVKFNNKEDKNRLIDLTRIKILKNTTLGIKEISPLPSEILNYSGGPGSILGIGNTSIPFADHTVNIDKNKKAGIFDEEYQPTTFLDPSQIDSKKRTFGIKEDFRKEILEDSKDPPKSLLSLSPSYLDYNISKRTHMGDPGKSNTPFGQKDVYNYGLKANELEALDKITALPIYEGEGPDLSRTINDLVKFRIAVVNNDKEDGVANYIHFRAFLNSFDDDYNSNYTPTQYVGRGDNFYKYSSFTRNISLTFTVAAQSKAELIPMYKKLNYLASVLTPDYTPSGFMRGNLVRLTLGGYLYEQYGILTNLRYSIPTESPWEIGINEEGNSDPSVKELPHIIQVTAFNFIPIHSFLPKKPQNPNSPDERFISLSNSVDSKGNYEDEYQDYIN